MSSTADRQPMESGLGGIAWWGFSPALDLQQAWLDAKLDDSATAAAEAQAPLNILIVGSGDQRHLLTTLARRRRHGERPLRIFILETDCSLYCRAVLQLVLCLDSRASIQERAELFLELHGNTLVREQTADHVTRLCPLLIRLVTDAEFCRSVLPLLELGELKFRERDIMEAVLKFWRQGLSDRRGFDAQLCWDLRLRQHLGVRYDAIPNVFDWDHQMRLVERGCGIVSRPEYLHWRTKGVAFRLREGAYDASNRTLCSGLVFATGGGERHARRGYWGDIVCGPYLAWGLLSEWREFDRKANGQFVNSVGAICEYNVCSLMHELRTGERYAGGVVDGDGGDTDVRVTELTEIAEVTEAAEKEAADAEAATVAPAAADDPNDGEPDLLPLDDVTVTFLPLGCLPSLANKAKYRGLFQVAYFSNSTVHLMAEQAAGALLADSAVVIAESALYMLELRPEQVVQFAEKVTSFAAGLDARPLTAADPAKDAHLTFVRRPQ